MEIKLLAETAPWDWPEDAAQTIHAVLEDDEADEEDRVIAAELAGEIVVMDDEMAGALLALLRRADLSDDLRAQAALALGPSLEECDTMGFDEPGEVSISEQTFARVNDALRELYHDADVPTEVRRRVLEAAVRAPQDWHEGAVRAAHASGDADWQLTALFCMEYVRGFDTEILAALERDGEVLYHAVCAAGAWEIDGAWDRVKALALDASTDKELRIAAIEAVVGIRPAEAAEVLGDLLDEDDDEIADAVDEALAMAKGFAELDDLDDDDDDR